MIRKMFYETRLLTLKGLRVEALWTEEKTPQLEDVKLTRRDPIFSLDNQPFQSLIHLSPEDLDAVINELSRIRADMNIQIGIKRRSSTQ